MTLGVIHKYQANGDTYTIRQTVKVSSVSWADGLQEQHNYAITKNGEVVVDDGEPLYFEHFNTGKGGAEPTFRAFVEGETGKLPSWLKPGEIKK